MALYRFLLYLIIYDHVSSGSRISVIQEAGVAYHDYGPIARIEAGVTFDLAIPIFPTLTAGSCQTNITNYIRSQLTSDLIALNKTVQVLASRAQYSVQSLMRRAKRMVGAIMAGVAIGIATAATIVSGVALARSLSAENMVKELKTFTSKLAGKTAQLAGAVSNLAFATQSLSESIDNTIIPAVNQLQCGLFDLKESVLLVAHVQRMQFFLNSIFERPDWIPVPFELLTQDVQNYIQTYWTQSPEEEMLNLRHKALLYRHLYGTIINVDADMGIMIMTVTVPHMSMIEGTHLLSVSSIIVKDPSGESRIVSTPDMILRKGDLSLIVTSDLCETASGTPTCRDIPSELLPDDLYNCLFLGIISDCPLHTVTESDLKAWTNVDGMVIANCRDFSCRCFEPPKVMYGQDHPLLVVTPDVCRRLAIGSIALTIRPRDGNVTFIQPQGSLNVEQPQIIHGFGLAGEFGKIGNNTKQIQSEILKIKDNIDSMVVGSTSLLIWLIILTCVIVVLFLLIMYLCFKTRMNVYRAYPKIGSDIEMR